MTQTEGDGKEMSNPVGHSGKLQGQMGSKMMAKLGDDGESQGRLGF